MRDDPPDRPFLTTYALGGAIAALLGVAGLWREAWLDEAATLRIVTAADWVAWSQAFLSDQQPPTYPLLLTLWAAIATSVPWLRMFSLLCGVTTVMLAARWAGRFSWHAGVVAAALLAGSPFFLRYALELRPYALLTAAATAAFLAAHTWAAEPRVPNRMRLMLVAALMLACTSHFTGILLIPATFVLIVTTRGAAPARSWPWGEYAATLMVWGAMLVAQRNTLPRLADGWWMPAFSGPLALRTLAEVAGLNAPGAIAGTATLTALGGLALIAAVLCARAPARTWLPALVAALVYGAAIAMVSLVWRPIWWPRTLLPTIVPCAVALGAAAGSQPTRSARLAASVVLVMLAAAGAVRWAARDARAPVEPWADAAAGVLTDAGVPTVCVPDYAAWPIARVLPEERARRLVPLRLGTTPEGRDAALDPALGHVRRGGSVNVVVRVDLSLQRELGLIDALALALAEARSPHRDAPGPATTRGAVHVAIVSSPDVSLVPALADTARAVETVFTTRLGAAAERRARRGITLLLY